MKSNRSAAPAEGANLEDALCPGGLVLAAALEYLRRGWSIIPVVAGTKKPPKRFRWKRFQKSRPSEEELRDWFDGRDDLGLAVIFGEVSGGLACRDFDNLASYRQWRRGHRDLARMLPTVETARPGRHVYFRSPVSHQVFKDLHPHGEYRGDSGHFCLLPPSQHPRGPQYKWLVPLPGGELPYIQDVVAAGLLPREFFSPDETQKAQGKHKKSQVVVKGVRGSGVKGVQGGEGGRVSTAHAVRLSVEAQTIVRAGVVRCIPSRPGTRRAKLFELVRRIKFTPQFVNLPAAEIGFLKPYVRDWWKLAKPHTSGKHAEFWQSWQDFVYGWEEARVPYGATMEGILQKARSSPPPRVAVEKYGQGSLRALLAALCRELQRLSGDKPFYLTGRTAGPLIGVSDTQAWRLLKTLEGDKIIVAVTKYPRGKRRATEYRYLHDL